MTFSVRFLIAIAGITTVFLIGIYVLVDDSKAAEPVQLTHIGLSSSSPAESCQSCHTQIYDEWKESFHAKATTSPAFRGMFTLFDFDTSGEAPQECLNCHSTDSKLTQNYAELREAILSNRPNTPGVTCTSCHGITSVEDVPDLLVPVDIHRVSVPAHNVEAGELFKQEVLCSSCHDYNNSHAVQGDWARGVPCCDTNRDFRRTEMAKTGVTCQTCHMAPGLEEDPAAWKNELSNSWDLKNTLLKWLNLDRYAENDAIRSHRFPGSHDAPMLKTAFEIEFAAIRTDDIVSANISIENLTGHSIPNGCPPRTRMYLRVWLEDNFGFPLDSDLIEYGFNFKDENGNEPAMVDKAVSRGFDQVFEAEQIDLRTFSLSLAGAGEGPVNLKASLTYVHFVMPPPEAQNLMQQRLIEKMNNGDEALRDFVLNTEIPKRMASMNRLASAYAPIVVWQANGVIPDSGDVVLESAQ